MATPSARSFNQYSGIDRFKQQQKSIFGDKAIPSAFDRMQDPGKYGAGTFARQALESPAYSGSIPISERPATSVGRSSMDPTRLAEQAFRRTRDPMERLKIGMVRQNLMDSQNPPDELNQIMQDQAGQNMGDTKDYGGSQGRGPIRKPYMGYNPNGRTLVHNAMSSRKPSYI